MFSLFVWQMGCTLHILSNPASHLLWAFHSSSNISRQNGVRSVRLRLIFVADSATERTGLNLGSNFDRDCVMPIIGVDSIIGWHNNRCEATRIHCALKISPHPIVCCPIWLKTEMASKGIFPNLELQKKNVLDCQIFATGIQITQAGDPYAQYPFSFPTWRQFLLAVWNLRMVKASHCSKRGSASIWQCCVHLIFCSRVCGFRNRILPQTWTHGVNNDGVWQALRHLQFVSNSSLLPFLGATTWFLGNGNEQGFGALGTLVDGGTKTFLVHNVQQFVKLGQFPRSDFESRNV